MMQLVCKLGAFSVKHMTGTRADGQAYDFYSLEKRTFNKEKNDWESRDIILTPAEMAAAAALTAHAAAQIAVQEARAANERLAAKSAQTGEGVPF